MPLINRLSNDYDPTQGVAGGIRNLGAVMATLPAVRARADLMRAQQGRYGAMSDEAEARAQEALSRAGLTDTQSDKGKMQIEGAKNIAAVLSDPNSVTKDSMGNVIISAPAFQTILGEMAKTGTGANDIGGGLTKMLTTQNAPVQEQANRQNKIDVAKIKPIVLNPGQQAFENTGAEPQQQFDPDTGDPSGTSVASRLIASSPALPAKALPDYTTTTIRDERNPAYNITEGATNVPPVIKMTNIVSRIAGGVKPQAQIPVAPNPNQRQQGQVYQTPKGALKWTGTGWVQP